MKIRHFSKLLEVVFVFGIFVGIFGLILRSLTVEDALHARNLVVQSVEVSFSKVVAWLS